MKKDSRKARRMIQKAKYVDLSPEEFRDEFVKEANQVLKDGLSEEKILKSKLKTEDRKLQAHIAIETKKMHDPTIIRKSSVESSLSGEITVRWQNEKD